jgi:hypothetical protein
MTLLSREQHDALVSEVATLLAGPERAAVFEALTISTLSQFLMPSPREYENFFAFRRACSETHRLFENMGIFEVTGDGRIIDHNDLHRPLTKDGAYYSKSPDGPAVLEA